MPDTEENQTHYPQPSSQARGVQLNGVRSQFSLIYPFSFHFTSITDPRFPFSNTKQPHSALGYRPPAPEAIQLHQPTIEAVNAVQ